MIVFASAITKPEIYERFAAPGIRLAREPDSEVLAFESTGSIFRNYNLICDQVAPREEVEALVLVHQDAEIVDPQFSSKVRAALEDPQVAIVGGAGAVDVRSIAWWEGSITWASYTHSYEELGGGEFASLTWAEDEIPPYAQTGEVDSIDGFVMAMSPWAFRELRFDESLGALHGYDLDICLQARAAGRKVRTADLRVIHNHSLELIGDLEGWIRAHMAVAEKWEGRMPHVGEAGGDWKQRARRAEAEASAARLMAGMTDLLRDRLAGTQLELEELTQSRSWRVTAPLRWAERLLQRGR